MHLVFVRRARHFCYDEIACFLLLANDITQFVDNKKKIIEAKYVPYKSKAISSDNLHRFSEITKYLERCFLINSKKMNKIIPNFYNIIIQNSLPKMFQSKNKLNVFY